jgi:hypothetical protein
VALKVVSEGSLLTVPGQSPLCVCWVVESDSSIVSPYSGEWRRQLLAAILIHIASTAGIRLVEASPDEPGDEALPENFEVARATRDAIAVARWRAHD